MLISSSKALFPTSKLKALSCTCQLKRNSHVGRNPISVPSGVQFLLDSNPSFPPSTTSPVRLNRSLLYIQGPKGKLTIEIPQFIQFDPPLTNTKNFNAYEGNLALSIDDERIGLKKTMWGCVRALVNNAIVGVSTGHELEVNLVGVGYRVTMEDVPNVDTLPMGAGGGQKAKRLNFKLGFSHSVIEIIPEGIEVEIKSSTNFIIKGSDKQAIGEYS